MRRPGRPQGARDAVPRKKNPELASGKPSPTQHAASAPVPSLSCVAEGIKRAPEVHSTPSPDARSFRATPTATSPPPEETQLRQVKKEARLETVALPPQIEVATEARGPGQLERFVRDAELAR
eukprot:1480865-Rhodomonas_salina.1